MKKFGNLTIFFLRNNKRQNTNSRNFNTSLRGSEPPEMKIHRNSETFGKYRKEFRGESISKSNISRVERQNIQSFTISSFVLHSKAL
jgi:hypothetical protein